MLKVDKPTGLLADQDSWPLGSELAKPGSLLRILALRWKGIASAVVAALIGGVAFCMLAPPMYTAQLLILVGPNQAALGDLAGGRVASPSFGDTALNDSNLESQVEILKSEFLARQVIDRLHLADDPEFANGWVSALAERLAGVSGLDVAKSGATSGAPADPARATASEIPQRALRAFERALDVRRVRETFVIAVSFTSHDPQHAASTANAVASSYLEEQAKSAAGSLQLEHDWLEARLRDLNARILDTEQALHRAAAGTSGEQTVGQLQRDIETYRSIYESYLDRFTRIAPQSAYPLGQARILAQASAPQRRSFPNTGIVLALSVCVGLAVGIGRALLWSLRDHSFRTPQEVERSLQTRCFGVIAHIPRGRSAIRRLKWPEGEPGGLRRHLLGRRETAAPSVEALRAIKLAVDTYVNEPGVKVVGITSALPGEGKSVLAVNFAALAACRQKVLLLDANLRNPTVTTALLPGKDAPRSGAQPADIEAAQIAHRVAGGFDVLSVSRWRADAGCGDTLGSQEFRRLLETVSRQYDYVIMDLPALALAVDCQEVAPAVDVFVLALEWGVTAPQAAAEVLRSAPAVYDKLIGAVLNKVDLTLLRLHMGTAGQVLDPARTR
jgi:uncharacterized protein involved in exopolysaccharide biosynthesis/Mrp family chromosome partitioning ATPase